MLKQIGRQNNRQVAGQKEEQKEAWKDKRKGGRKEEMKEREGRKEGVDLTKNFHVLEFCIRKQVYTKNVSNLDTVALPRIQPSQKVIYQIK